MKNFRFYPTLNQTHVQDSKLFVEKYTFHYKTDKQYQIETDNEDDPIVLYDAKGIWDINRDNLIVQSSIRVEHPNKLFGEKGLAVNDAKIGIGLKWYSSESKMRGLKHVGDIINTKDVLTFDVALNFKKNYLRKNITLEPILFVSKPGNIKESFENVFANDKGVVIGTLGTTQIILEGQRSEFPVVEIKDKKRPLWEVVANFYTGEENFNDAVCLTINAEHKDYKFIDRSDKDFSPTLLEEIMVNVVVFLVHKGMDEQIISFDSEESSELGTVAYVLEHWVQIYDLKDESIIDLHKKVSKKIRG